MKEAELILVDTKEGIHTLFNKTVEEHYHSLFGSLQESMHVFIRNGLIPVARKYDEIRILEIGFGTGLNAALTYRENHILQKHIHYTTVEINPLPIKVIQRLNYAEYFGSELQPVFLEMHKCKWFEKINLTLNKERTSNGNEEFLFYKIHNDVLECSFDDSYDLVYFDAFSPAHQPELWQFELFKKIYDACNIGAALVSNCSKVDVKRTLSNVGFKVESLEGPKGKREMIRAVK
ncbi:MAG: tRNA (5-methylaminomethyl-2-thiouridine)(34)-methyltransferase MnmD [Bacteroidia bacterium]